MCLRIYFSLTLRNWLINCWLRDYGLWKSLKYEVLEMNFVNDMNMKLSYGENDWENDIEN